MAGARSWGADDTSPICQSPRAGACGAV